jgi:UDP-N-acetylmuramate--alanine ligase
MAANLLMCCGLRPTTAVGGIVNGSSSHAHTGEGKYFVTEVDESDGSFLNFAPHYSVITNIDFEHVDYYHNWPNILRAYRSFVDKTVSRGVVIIYGDDERLSRLLQESGRNFRTYGFGPRNDIRAAGMLFDRFNSKFDCIVDGKNYGPVALNVPGRHNVANAMACISLGLSLSIDFAAVVDSLTKFYGVQRRFQLKGRVDDVWVVDDYAHHPTEIQNTLATAELFKQSIAASLPGRPVNRLIAVFQPHRYSRVNGLMEEFAESLTRCDHLVVTDIYAAGEQPIQGVTAEKLCERVRTMTDKPVRYLPKNEIVDYLLDLVKPHDLVMTLGAGDITRLSDDLTEALKKQSAVTGKNHG